ncbi:efflux RND transporter periplasmic adaptor subunit [Comamonas guangdongensis]|uniref:Efflux RND transporter periplasmic adaptor subunit n=1 Tax=Comamonas guangdongensis TaxID=510515 RepID=A0ABV3ZTK5_9BURK
MKTKSQNLRAWSALAALAAAMMLAGCIQPEAGGPPQELPLVDVMTVKPRPLSLSAELPGRIEPVRVAEVRARVPGIVLSRNFKEGADVKAGEVLFNIDPAPLRAALSRAQGELARAEAALADAQSVVSRYEPLVVQEAVSRQDFDSAKAALHSAKAMRQSARAEVETARLNLDYATVKAPISGRIGRALVTEGALVGQGEATPMAVIQQLDPIYADFRQPAALATRWRAQHMLGGKPESSTPVTLVADGIDGKRQGRMLFSDVTVDRGTGQLALRGEFPNKDGLLLPGMYVRVTVAQGQDPAAILVPQRAVQRGSDGLAHVLVLDEQGVVQSQSVSTGAMYGSDWHITEGLKENARVLVGGLAAAVPGTKVQIRAAAEKDTAATTKK